MRLCGWLIARAARAGESAAERDRKAIIIPTGSVFGPLLLLSLAALWPQLTALQKAAHVVMGVSMSVGAGYALATRTLPLVLCGGLGYGSIVALVLADINETYFGGGLSYWPMSVIVLDFFLVINLPRRWSIGVVTIVTAYLVFRAVHIGYLTVAVHGLSVAESALTGIIVIAGTAAVLVLDFVYTRRFAENMRRYLSELESSIDIAQVISLALAQYDLKAAAVVMSEKADNLPDELRDAYSVQLHHLAEYRPYLPEAVLQRSPERHAILRDHPRQEADEVAAADASPLRMRGGAGGGAPAAGDGDEVDAWESEFLSDDSMDSEREDTPASATFDPQRRQSTLSIEAQPSAVRRSSGCATVEPRSTLSIEMVNPLGGGKDVTPCGNTKMVDRPGSIETLKASHSKGGRQLPARLGLRRSNRVFVAFHLLLAGPRRARREYWACVTCRDLHFLASLALARAFDAVNQSLGTIYRFDAASGLATFPAGRVGEATRGAVASAGALRRAPGQPRVEGRAQAAFVAAAVTCGECITGTVGTSVRRAVAVHGPDVSLAAYAAARGSASFPCRVSAACVRDLNPSGGASVRRGSDPPASGSTGDDSRDSSGARWERGADAAAGAPADPPPARVSEWRLCAAAGVRARLRTATRDRMAADVAAVQAADRRGSSPGESLPATASGASRDVGRQRPLLTPSPAGGAAAAAAPMPMRTPPFQLQCPPHWLAGGDQPDLPPAACGMLRADADPGADRSLGATSGALPTFSAMFGSSLPTPESLSGEAQYQPPMCMSCMNAGLQEPSPTCPTCSLQRHSRHVLNASSNSISMTSESQQCPQWGRPLVRHPCVVLIGAFPGNWQSALKSMLRRSHRGHHVRVRYFPSVDEANGLPVEAIALVVDSESVESRDCLMRLKPTAVIGDLPDDMSHEDVEGLFHIDCAGTLEDEISATVSFIIRHVPSRTHS